MNFTKLNKSTKLFNVDVKEPVFKKLNDFNSGDIFKVLGCYKNTKSVYGEEPVFIVSDNQSNIFFVNCPKHHLETINTIIADKELVDGINNGYCFIEVTKYYSKKYKKECTDFDFIEPDKTKKEETSNAPEEQAKEEISNNQPIF